MVRDADERIYPKYKRKGKMMVWFLKKKKGGKVYLKRKGSYKEYDLVISKSDFERDFERA